MKKIIIVLLMLGLTGSLNACRSIWHCFGLCKDTKVEQSEVNPTVVTPADGFSSARGREAWDQLKKYDLCNHCGQSYKLRDKIIFLSCGHHICFSHLLFEEFNHELFGCKQDAKVLLTLSSTRLVKLYESTLTQNMFGVDKVGPHSIYLLLKKFERRPQVLASIQSALETNILNLSNLGLTSADLLVIVRILLAIGLNETLNQIDLSGMQKFITISEQLNQRHFPQLSPASIIITNNRIQKKLIKQWIPFSVTPRVLTPLQESTYVPTLPGSVSGAPV